MKVDYTLYTDGGSRGNPGPAAIGIVIQNDGGVVIEDHASYIGEATNNVAEYSALVQGLKMLVKLARGKNIVCVLDSELVVKQLNGQYRVKDQVLRKLYEQVLVLKTRFTSVSFKHVRRELNKEADALVNQALDAQQL